MAHRKRCAGSPGNWPSERRLVLRLLNAVADGSWRRVETLLDSWDFSYCLRAWALTAILGQAQGEDLSSCISYAKHLCPGSPRLHSTLLDICLHRRLWDTLYWMLEEGLLDADQRRRAIEELSQHGDEWDLSLILRHCADDQLDSVFDEIRRRDLWRSVVLTLEKNMRSTRTSSSVRRIVEKAVEYADSDHDHVFYEILRYCADDQLDSMLEVAVRRNWWYVYSVLIRRMMSETERREAVEAASERAEDDLLSSLLYYCADDQISFVVETVVSRRLWSCACRLLERSDVSETQRRLLVREVISHADSDHQVSRVIPYCTDDEVETALHTAVQKDMWESVGLCLKRGIPETQWRWALEQVTARMDQNYSPWIELVFRCSNDYREFILRTAVDRKMWKVVPLVLEENIDSSLRVWAVEQVSLKAEEQDLTDCIRSSCRSYHRNREDCCCASLDCVIEIAVCRNLWDAVGVSVQHNVSINQRRFAVEEARKHANDTQFSRIAPYCTDDQLNSVLEETARRRLWDVVVWLLKRINKAGITDTNGFQRAAIEEALIHADQWQMLQIVSELAESEVGCFLHTAVNCGMWDAVIWLLERVRDIGDKMKLKWAVEEAYTRADDEQFSWIAGFCHDDQLEAVLTEAVKREQWSTVLSLIERIAESDIEKSSELQAWVLLEASQRASDRCLADFVRRKFFHEQTFDSVLRQAVQRGLWYTVGKFFKRMKSGVITCPSETLRWALEMAADQAGRDDFRTLIRHVDCHFIPSAFIALMKNGKQDVAEKCIMELFQNLDSHQMLSSWARLFEGSLVTDGTSFSTSSDTDVSTCLQLVMHFNDMNISIFVRHLLESTTMYSQDTLSAGEPVVWSTLHIDDDSCQSKLVYEKFFRWCIEKRGQLASLSQVSLPLIASQAVNPALQRLARTSMWEETRRWYLQFLVEEKLWDIVKELADHSLYDDQRGWALGQALYDKQWDVMVLLADHGLTNDQLRRVYRQVAKHADWHTVRQLFERGVDMRVVCEELMAANPSRDRPPDRRRIERYRNQGEDVTELEEEYKARCEHVAKIEAEYKERCRELAELERAYRCQEMTVEQLLLSGQWYAVLTKLREGTTDQTELVLHHAMQMEAWHVVMQLVRLGMDTAHRDSLFSQVIRRRQWGVGRALLERGVSVELSRAALPQLMETDQWILVARVMELSLDDTERRRVMQAALDKKEGSVVAHGISVMEGRQSVKEREATYDQALSQGVWQAVKRLVEEKDNIGMAQRDKALIAAVEQHRWDMVDHCDKHGADINKRDAEGDTLLHQKIKQKDRDRAKGLLHHGADPNLPDRGGNSALDTALDLALEWWHGSKVWYGEKWWDVVNSCVEFHGNINRPDSTARTPLDKLIATAKDNLGRCEVLRCAGIIDSALLWGGQVDWSTDCEGMTALHVLCQAGQWDSMRYLVARGGDPFAVTDSAWSVLLFALRYEIRDTLFHFENIQQRITRFAEAREVRQKLVSECIKMGISTHHPLLVARGGDPFAGSALSFALQYDGIPDTPLFESKEQIVTRFAETREVRQKLVSECIKMGISTHHPLLTARWSQRRMNIYSVMHVRDIVILHMLYESGACSNKELHQELVRNEASPKWNDEYDDHVTQNENDEYEDHVSQNEKRCMLYIRKWASSPRSLKSMCRLVISHSLGVGKPRWRQRRAKQLPLLDKENRLDLKGYVIFSDLVDPHFGQELRDVSPFEPVDGCRCEPCKCYFPSD